MKGNKIVSSMKKIDSILLRRLILSFVFAIAVISKISSIPQFEATVAYSNLIRSDFVMTATILLLLLELFLVVLLLIKRFEREAVFGILILSSIFFSYSIWRYLDKIKVPCNCFGALFKMEPWHGVLINTLIIMFCARLMVDILNRGGMRRI